ncbi:MAG: DNA replication/repair protein RecF [Lactobacillales bacterium]|jgi:DNA replication and repair protein RecF|nr:DNA replication/repair protein RecF [Lactobacillales bacterium]
MIHKTGIRQIRLTNFRSYLGLDLKLDASFPPVVLTGHNGAGKTNILEAVSFLTPGRGLRSARLSDVARRSTLPIGEEIIQLPERWSVSAIVETKDGPVNVGTGTIDGSERRQIRIDGKNTSRQSDLGAVMRCIWLTPAQDRLFCGDPVSRRRFLDRLVGAFDINHANRLTSYNAAFKEWSCLLREGRHDKNWLSALEEQMTMEGVAVAASRLDVTARVSAYLDHEQIPLFPTAQIMLTGWVEQMLMTHKAVDVEDAFLHKLQKSRHVYAEGGSLVGPHTADFKVTHAGKNMDAALCSTGEQKGLLLSIILAQLKAQMQEQGICPLLLLDEVSAHLDVQRRHLLFDILTDLPAQVWMTGTDQANFRHLAGGAQFFNIEDSVLNLQQVA